MMLYRLALQNYTSLEPDDDYVDLCEDEYESVYKALLYCNQVWTDGQLDDETTTGMIRGVEDEVAT